MKHHREEGELHSPKLSEELEDRLRPSRYLGYDRDHLGVALLRREMFEAAASQFKRAVYLNPYESAFKQHLAWCLYKMNRLSDALTEIDAALQQKPADPDSRIIRERILQAQKEGGFGEKTAP
uniref:Tetratricopeptide repeat protein n=1 Tax=Gracilinema caldarium TaxID=215591 RepID=A0A7C3E7D7_9SPIR